MRSSYVASTVALPAEAGPTDLRYGAVSASGWNPPWLWAKAGNSPPLTLIQQIIPSADLAGGPGL